MIRERHIPGRQTTETNPSIKPAEPQSALIGNLVPVKDDREIRLDEEYERALTLEMRGETPGEMYSSAIDHLLKAGRLRLGDLQEITDRVKKVKSRRQDLSGLRR